MAKGKVSIGDDTATGEPENGPSGPYITDKDDGTRRVRKPKKADDEDLPSRTETEISKKSELGSDR